MPDRTRRFCRPPRRPFARRFLRQPYHSCWHNFAGFRRRPDDLSRALGAFTRAIRTHRRLGKLAPEFFDSTEINRINQKRKDDAEWMAMWAPAFRRVYGSDPTALAPDQSAANARLPKSPRTIRAVEREFTAWQFWMSIGSLALARHKLRRPQALPAFTKVVRLIKIAFELGDLACGKTAELDNHEQALADLKRIYGEPHSKG